MNVSVKICGVDISAYTVVYPATYTDEQAEDVKDLFASLAEVLGCSIAVGTQAAAEKNVYVGLASDEEKSALGELDYVKLIKDGDVYLYGGSFWGDAKAVYSFVREDIGFDCLGGFKNLGADVRVLDVRYTYKKPPVDIAGTCNMGHLFTGEEDFLMLLKEGGINRITINLLNITVPNKVSVHRFMVLCAVYEIRVLWFDNAIKEQLAETVDYNEPADSPYFKACIEFPLTIGHYVWDEPGYDRFEDTARAFAGYKAAHPNKTGFVNMLPYYADPRTAFDNKDVEFYTEEFMRIIKPEEAWFDIYPFHTDGTTKERYMDNMGLVADAAVRYGVPFGVYIQGTAFANCRYPTGRDIYLQIWLCLAFGAKFIELFTYTTFVENNHESFGVALVDKYRKPTPSYYDCKRVLSDLDSFVDIYDTYRFLGAFSENCNKGEWNYHPQQYKGFDAIKQVKTDAPVLVGCFEGDGGKKAFCAVNVSDPTEPVNKTITVSFKTDADVCVHQAGKHKPLRADADGFVTLTLYTAEGAFIEII